MREFARSVSLKIEKSGGAVVVNQDNSVSIIMDGKVQVVLPSENAQAEENTVGALKSNREPQQHLR